MQNEIGRRQAVIEKRLQRLGLVRWSDFADEEEGDEEVWFGEIKWEKENNAESEDVKRTSQKGEVEESNADSAEGAEVEYGPE